MKDAVLVLGAGSRPTMNLFTGGRENLITTEDGADPTFSSYFKDVWTVDMVKEHNPRVVWNLEDHPWPVPHNYFDEVHAYEVLEHLGGPLGDFRGFFNIWRDIWNCLKPGGLVAATTPWWNSRWAFCDPGHCKVYSPFILHYLDQDGYSQVGKSTQTDYRQWWPSPYSFKGLMMGPSGEDVDLAGFVFVLQKHIYKPEVENVSQD